MILESKLFRFTVLRAATGFSWAIYGALCAANDGKIYSEHFPPLNAEHFDWNRSPLKNVSFEISGTLVLWRRKIGHDFEWLENLN